MEAQAKFQSDFGIKEILISVVFHGLLILAGIVLGLEGQDEKAERERLTLIKRKKLVESAVRVDVVSMPKLTVKELKNIKRLAPAEEEVKPVEKVAAKKAAPSETKSEDGGSSFKNLLKNLSEKKIDLKNVKKVKAAPAKVEKESKEEVQRREALAKLVLEGNRISKGNQVFSDKIATKKEKQGLELYAQTITSLIQPHWSLPGYLLNQSLSCQIRVYISENGDLLKQQVHKSSGNSEFDQRAIRAVERGAPFGVAPKEIRSRLVKGEILLGFPL